MVDTTDLKSVAVLRREFRSLWSHYLYMFFFCSFAKIEKALILLGVFSIDKCCVFLIYYTPYDKKLYNKKDAGEINTFMRQIQSAKKELYSNKNMMIYSM